MTTEPARIGAQSKGDQQDAPALLPEREVTATAPRSRTPNLSRAVLDQLQLLTDRTRLAPVVSKEEIKRTLGRSDNLGLSHERFNRVLLFHNVEPVTEEFFSLYFGGMIPSINALQDGINRVRKDSMLFFGSFRRGFETLSKSRDPQGIVRNPLVSRERPHEPFGELEQIPTDHLHLLGYRIEPSDDLPEKVIKDTRRAARANTERYLSRSAVDIYVASSMGTPQQFVAGQEFIDGVFRHADLSSLNLSHFNPLITWVDNSVQKGIVESLMLNVASVMLYLADISDSFGKDSELATMLQQGKPAIVYVPSTSDLYAEDYNKRAELFKSLHPLSFQIDSSTGVTHGVIVVRSVDECVQVLASLFSAEGLKTEITEDDSNYYTYGADYAKSYPCSDQGPLYHDGILEPLRST